MPWRTVYTLRLLAELAPSSAAERYRITGAAGAREAHWFEIVPEGFAPTVAR